MTNQFCVVIPVYNHHHKLKELLTAIAEHGLPVLLIDDGSEPASAELIGHAAAAFDFVKLTRLPENRGKGGAVKAGLLLAQEQGFSHALQVDADYQHDIGDFPQFIAQSKQHPQAMICGVPVYDESVNKKRLYARYLTHVWVWINTLSTAIKDSMCGYRVYPLETTNRLIERAALGDRMNFDTEVLVKLHWQGVRIINVPTAVKYHPDVPSNFRVFQDNVGISWMHTKLFFGMLVRLPMLLLRKMRRQ